MGGSFFQRGGAWVVAQFALMGAVAGLAAVLRGPPPPAVVWVIAAVLLLAGSILGVAGALALRASCTPLPKPRPGAQLIQSGIYAHIRHPLYTSVMLLGLGWAVLWRSWPALVVALTLIPFFHAKARREERWLTKKFAGYSDYARRVPRFWPRLRR